MALVHEIKSGIVNLNADYGDRFVFMINKTNIPMNYVRSTDFSKIKIARAYDNPKYPELRKRILTIKENRVIRPNTDLLKNRCFLLRISKVLDSLEDDAILDILSIRSCIDEIWQPNRITDKEDIWMESVILEVNATKGIL